MINRNNLIRTALISIFAALALAQPALAGNCGGAETSIIDCGGATGEDAVIGLIKIVIQIMTGGIGILAVGAVIVGGLIYASSNGSPEKLKKAHDIWQNTVIGLILFAFLVAITNFLIPGGVFG